MKWILIVFLVMFSYFTFSEVCIRIDGKINGFDKDYYFLKVNEKVTLRILKKRLAKTLDRFLYMNKNNRVQECYPANSIEKPFQKIK